MTRKYCSKKVILTPRCITCCIMRRGCGRFSGIRERIKRRRLLPIGKPAVSPLRRREVSCR